MKEFSERLLKVLNSRKLFRIILIFFIFEATWIALSAAYPQAFDENFHFGLIQVYSHYWFPFLSKQPPNADAYGAVARDPSYLYHYLMSFPYRLISLVFHEEIGQVIALRLINVGLFAVGLILSRRILLRAGISVPLANLCIFLVALIPIAPQLAAQINYDNLLMPLVAWIILISFDLLDQLKVHKPSIKTLVLLISMCLFTSLVKYAFLPIFLGIVVFMVVVVFIKYRHKFRTLFQQLLKSWKQLSVKIKILLVAVLLISVGMFIQRDGVNLIKYHSIEPNCATVLTVKDCSQYSVWKYNYTSHNWVVRQENAGKLKFMNPISYTLEWLYWMWYRLFFSVNGPNTNFTNYPPLPLPSAAAILIALIGLYAFIKYWRRIFAKNTYLVLLFIVSALYILALFAQGYSSYHYTNVLQNMNGRYLLPVIFFLIAILGTAFSIALKNKSNRKTLLVAVVLILFLQGGGLLTFISRSDDNWDVQNHTVKKVNDVARKITKPVIINGKKTYSTNLWFFN